MSRVNFPGEIEAYNGLGLVMVNTPRIAGNRSNVEDDLVERFSILSPSEKAAMLLLVRAMVMSRQQGWFSERGAEQL